MDLVHLVVDELDFDIFLNIHCYFTHLLFLFLFESIHLLSIIMLNILSRLLLIIYLNISILILIHIDIPLTFISIFHNWTIITIIIIVFSFILLWFLLFSHHPLLSTHLLHLLSKTQIIKPCLPPLIPTSLWILLFKDHCLIFKRHL